MSYQVTMIDERTVTEISGFESYEQAAQWLANQPVTVGTVTAPGGEVYYQGFVGEHCVGDFLTEQHARIAASLFDRSELISECPSNEELFNHLSQSAD